MPSKTDTAIAHTISIDTGKNTLHMIGLDEKGAIVLREKVSRIRIAARSVNVPPCLIGIEAGMASSSAARHAVRSFISGTRSASTLAISRTSIGPCIVAPNSNQPTM